MARFVLAWELNGGADHLSPLVHMARSLLERGHHVDFILHDLGAASVALGELMQHPRVALWPAPAWRHHEPQAAHLSSHSVARLMTEGYASPPGLLGLVTGWRTMLQALDPDVLVADHAPTALLAARGLRFPCIQIKDGETPDSQASPAQATQVLNACNAVLAQLGQSPLSALAELINPTPSLQLQAPNVADQLIALSKGPQHFVTTPVHAR